MPKSKKMTSQSSKRLRFRTLFNADFVRHDIEPLAPKEPQRILVTKTVDLLYKIGSVGLTLLFIGILLVTVNASPPFGQPDTPAVNEVSARYVQYGIEETGATNAVAGMILDYRAFDTFGEVLMMFSAAMAVIALLHHKINEEDPDDEDHA